MAGGVLFEGVERIEVALFDASQNLVEALLTAQRIEPRIICVDRKTEKAVLFCAFQHVESALRVTDVRERSPDVVHALRVGEISGRFEQRGGLRRPGQGRSVACEKVTTKPF